MNLPENKPTVPQYPGNRKGNGREAIDRGCDFLSSDQEAQIREAASGIIHEAPEAIIYSTDCRAKQLCQENPSVEMTLLVTTIEEIVQSLVKELVKTKSRYDAASSDQESLSRESINTAYK
jgi:hypothetical protein